MTLNAQVSAPTSTPAQIQLASVTLAPNIVMTTPAVGGSGFEISGDTATPRGITMLEPISEVNVRSSPEIADNNQLGVIRAGERYMVIGQYFNWIQFQYDLAPDGSAWVYRDLVEIIGNEQAIPTLVPNATSTPDPLIAGATQTREAILAAPGGALTVTAQSRIIQLPDGSVDTANEDTAQQQGQNIIKPTFTYPPGVVAGVPTLVATRAIDTGTPGQANGTPIAPIIPISVLGLFGLLGIGMSVLRR